MKLRIAIGLVFAAATLSVRAAEVTRTPAPAVPDKVCADCHDQEAKVSKSAHASVACASCHLNHHEYPHPEKQPKPKCSSCHESTAADYEQSEHAQQMRRGNGMAPDCSTCHGTAHEMVGTRTETFHRGVPDTCGMCHDKEKDAFAVSVHGKAVASGVKDAPVCTDCHGGHRILKPDNPKSTVFAGSVPDTCGRCHGDVRLMKRFGLPSDRITSFNSSFHGLALKSGNQSVADCSSCHGFHDILPSADPKSRTNTKNLGTTCGACHPGAGTRFAISTIHEAEGGGAPKPVHYAQLFYLMVIPGTVGFMLLHQGADYIQKLVRLRFRGAEYPVHILRPQRTHERMYKLERIQHLLLTISFLVLVYTGFALHFPDDWWAKPLLALETRFPIRGTVHRTAGVILVLTSIFHVITLLSSRRLRKHWMELIPRVSDAREMVEGTLWRLGLRKQMPSSSAHSYIEKIEYWALIWGTLVMAATGVLLWANNWTMKFLPKMWIDFSRTVHYLEAVLATLSILIWHFYSVILDPDVYPMDASWLTGYSPRHEEDHKSGD
jgi:cytochrome b subunit of formate dehydrogenase